MPKNYLPNFLTTQQNPSTQDSPSSLAAGLKVQEGPPYLTPPKPLTRRQAAILALTLRLQSPHPPACGRFPCSTHHHSHSLSLLLSTYLPHPLIHHALSFTPPCRPHPVDHTLPTTPLTQSLLTLALFLVTPRFEPPTFGLPIGLLI